MCVAGWKFKGFGTSCSWCLFLWLGILACVQGPVWASSVRTCFQQNFTCNSSWSDVKCQVLSSTEYECLADFHLLSQRSVLTWRSSLPSGKVTYFSTWIRMRNSTKGDILVVNRGEVKLSVRQDYVHVTLSSGISSSTASRVLLDGNWHKFDLHFSNLSLLIDDSVYDWKDTLTTTLSNVTYVSLGGGVSALNACFRQPRVDGVLLAVIEPHSRWILSEKRGLTGGCPKAPVPPTPGGRDPVPAVLGVCLVLMFFGGAIGGWFLYRYIREERSLRGVYKPNRMEQRAARDLALGGVLKIPPLERLI